MDDAASVLSMGVTSGLIALAAALFVATALGLALRRPVGRFRAGSSGAAAKTRRPETTGLTEADLGRSLGRRATLVQFSTAFCAPCRPTRQILAQVAGMVDGVTHVEVDAAERLDLVRGVSVPIASLPRPASGVTARVSPHTIGFVTSRTARTLTKRRAVDFCHVATAICPPAALP
jgi:thiol-disulfide isomerase/thioredoxin